MAVLLGSFFAKLLSIGGLVAFIAGFTRNAKIGVFGLLIGIGIEYVLHAGMVPSSQVGYATIPLAATVAVLLGRWAAGIRLKRE